MSIKARNYIEIKKSLIEYVRHNYPEKIYNYNRTPQELERDFLIMEIAKLKQEIAMLRDK